MQVTYNYMKQLVSKNNPPPPDAPRDIFVFLLGGICFAKGTQRGIGDIMNWIIDQPTETLASLWNTEIN